MSSVKRLISKQTALKKQIEKFIENAKKTALARRTQGFYENRIADLKKIWQDFSENDSEINTILLDEPTNETYDYIKTDQYGEIELKYSEYMGDLLDGLRNVTTPVVASNDSSLNTTGISNRTLQPETHLPKISLPKYNGDYDLWRSFHDLFVSLVHNNNNLSSVHKLHYLKGCLVGEAEKVLRHTPITNEDYEPAWQKLKARYENKRILVNHQLKLLLNQPKLIQETAKGIKSLLDTTEECLQQLKALEVNTTSWDAILIYLLVQRLPFVTLKLWEENQGASQDLPRYNQFNKFLHTRLKVLESISDTLISKPQTKANCSTKETMQSYHITKENKCPACNEVHFVAKCRKYKQFNVEQRRRIIVSDNRCLNCFSRNHTISNCSSRNRCFKCNGMHHTTLHEDKTDVGEKSNEQSSHRTNSVHRPNQRTTSANTTTQNFVAIENQHALLGTALAVTTGLNGQKQKLRCLIDPGSQSSFITSTAYRKLHIPSIPASIVVTGLGNSESTIANNQVQLQLGAYWGNSEVVNDNFLIVDKITNILPSKVINAKEWQHLNNLQLADPTFCKPGKIDVLLGAQSYAQILCEGIRRGPTSAPIGIHTKLGWIILGPAGQLSKEESKTFMVTTDDLDKQLKRFWEIEELHTKPRLSEEEEQCELFFQHTHKRLPNGKYQVKLPFAAVEGPVLGQSRQQALQRFMHLQRKFHTNPQFEVDYRNCLNEYIDLDHMEQINPPNETEPNYYIPHHAVIKDSTTTKLRVVFDASARSSNGKSLNSQLLPGPILQPKLFATLLNWRKYKFALNADIEKMYRMIELHPADRTYQRIIWQDPRTLHVRDFQLKTVTFGTSSAPYLAIRVLQQLAQDEKYNYPLASQLTYVGFYVDDLLTGAYNILDAKKLRDEFIDMLKTGGFKLRKWTSNNLELLEDLPLEDRELKGSLAFADNESVKTLGIRWHPRVDYFSWTITRQPKHSKITKRIILSEIASLYDPLGWLAPILITAKILMQTLWITGCSWDAPVLADIQQQWDTFKEELIQIENIKIPRWINYSPGLSMQLHGFCDASMKAYAAVIYLRVQDETGTARANLLTSKTKVSPIKPTTIPRLELNGALLLARLIKQTVNDMQLQDIPIVAWTDSTIALQWIKQHPSRWKCYVANRVGEIQDILRYDKWRHVPTKDNPADIASRGIAASNLVDNELWWNGPSWLRLEASQWPEHKHLDEQTELEAKQYTTTIMFAKTDDSILLKYSSFTRLTRIIATIKRFIFNCKNPRAKQLICLTNKELQEAETTIFKLVQKTEFPEDYNNLLNKKGLGNKSRILSLNPFIDENGVIRVGGRLENAAIPYSRKHPIILPRNHHVTSMIVDKTHAETLHGGTSLTLNTLRNRFWILGGRRIVTARLHRCIICTRHRKATITQLMGNLPSPRVNVSKPFAEVGIDYAGPIQMKTSTHRNCKIFKGYICIFVCMATKAIHIEPVSDLTSSAFIATLKRFVSRRGLCKNIYSDCGTNFVGAKTIIDRSLRMAIKEATPEATAYLASKAINWNFNPPAAPHFGGLWEAGVKSIKYHLRRIIGNGSYTFEEYATMLSEIEACLNSRPLSYIQSNSDDPLVLTPGHFLIGQPLNAMVEVEHTTHSLTQRWQHLQQLVKSFWDKWSKEYLHQFQQRPKWKKTLGDVKVDDIVIVKQDNTSPTNWPLGRIKEIFPGKDGLTRVVQVQTKGNCFLRPITKIVKIPMED